MPAVPKEKEDKEKTVRVPRVAKESLAIKKTRQPSKKKLTNMTDINADSMTDNSDLRSLLLSIRETQCTKSDMEKFTDTVNSKLVSIETKVSSQDAKIESFNHRLEKCENQAASAQYQLEIEKQRSLKNNVSIFGVSNTDDDKMNETVSAIFKKIGCAVDGNQIGSCYKIKGNSNNIIIVKLNDYELKRKILKEKSTKPLTLGDVISCEANIAKTVIYINNHVTPFFGKLLKEGRIAVKKSEIHSCWINSFGCQLKFDENGKHYSYKSVDELKKLIANNSTKNQVPTGKRSAPDDRSPSGNNNKNKK